MKVSRKLNFVLCQNQHLLTFRAKVIHLICTKGSHFASMGQPIMHPVVYGVWQPSPGVTRGQDFSEVDTCSPEVLPKLENSQPSP